MSKPADVIIVGSGLAGLTVALECAEVGLYCTLLSATTAGAASPASAGLLAPSLGGFTTATREHAFAARDFYPEYITRIEHASGQQVPLLRNGIIQLIAADSELPAGKHLLSRADLRALEPALPETGCAVLHEHDGAVDVPRLLSALMRCLALHTNVRIISGTATMFRFVKSHVEVEFDGREMLAGEQIVLAAGAWSPALARAIAPLPVIPLSGQTIIVTPNPVNHAVYADGCYLVPRGEQMIVGATSVTTGLSARIDPADSEALLQQAKGLLPDIAALGISGAQAGIRPMTPDGLPILGRDFAEPRLIYASGYGRNGVLLAPWAAKQLAQVIAGFESPAIELFSPRRFESVS